MRLSSIDKTQRGGSSGTTQLMERKHSAKQGKLDKFILLQVAWCTFPALILMRMGQLRASGIWCFFFLLIFLLVYVLRRNSPAFVALTVATLPALLYTRAFFLHNSVLVLLCSGLILWFVHSPREGLGLWNNRIFRWFFIAGTVYWSISIALTGQYYANIRVMEMLGSVGSIYLLARHPRYLASALAGLGVSIFSVSIGIMGLGERLGVVYIEGNKLGNPISFGLPIVLVLLMTIADNGKWLLLKHSTIGRYFLIAMCGVFLLLSTSRGSWLVAFVGIAVIFFYQSKQRGKILGALLLVVCVLLGVLQTESGEKAFVWYEKLFDPDRDLSQQTTGRSEMWVLFPKVLKDYPLWGVGPGLGPEAYAEYSLRERGAIYHQGSEMAWHALYLQIGVEAGMIGLAILFGFLGRLFFNCIRYRQITRNSIPLMGILCFMTIGLSVPALEGISGLFLGIAFLGTMPLKK